MPYCPMSRPFTHVLSSLISDSGDQQLVGLSGVCLGVSDVVCGAKSVRNELAKVSAWTKSDCLEAVAMAEESVLQRTVGHVRSSIKNSRSALRRGRHARQRAALFVTISASARPFCVGNTALSGL